MNQLGCDTCTLNDVKNKLKRKTRGKGVNGFLGTLEHIRTHYKTTDGIAGTQLLQLNNEKDQRGLVEMAHAYLCVFGHGHAHWPQGSKDGTLEYPRDEKQIYFNVLCHFIRKNMTIIHKRIRSKRPRDEDGVLMPRPPKRRRRQTPESESPPLLFDPSPPLSPSPPIPSLYDSSSDESDTLLPSSQDSHSTTISEQEARQDVYQIIPRANESPDELAQDDEQRPAVQPDLQQRYVNRLGDKHGNISRISLGHQPTPRGPRTNLHERNISIGTKTTPSVNRQRDANAPPPSSLDTDSNSQQTQNPVSDKANEAEEPSSQNSIEDVPRVFGALLVHPRMAVPEPEVKIDLVVTYDVIPGLNRLFRYKDYIFKYSLKGFLDAVNWQNEPEVLLVCLQAPGTSPAMPVRTWIEWVFKRDEDKFQLVLRRFKQIYLDLKYHFARVKMDAVIEIAFENMVEGHTHSHLVDAWCGRAPAGNL
ncbi:hypothetical protein FPSE_10810 [Fusarium pseudograminearum CS3096]|uniref:Uncharacterized protein n=1 Tax=Fusarium pseudograminearum (strain CS3096) TaxID=1028729 RepID=K3V6L0_FUSPC|nr:hypothetical protein FPSE_10810 [Fusarium pseudograminearum CS3096]EKJ69017.1 hypothetical protein FPSE_10810 [Fusarium pseudograminearum CS3096]